MNIEQSVKLVNEKQRYFFIGKEKEYEAYLVNEMLDICEGLKLPPISDIKTQQRFDIGTFSIKPDIMVFHNNGTLSVFEVKCGNSRYPSAGVSSQTQAIGQILLYKNVLEELRKDKVRMFLVDQKIYSRTICVFAQMKLPITLVEIQNGRVFVPYQGTKI